MTEKKEEKKAKDQDSTKAEGDIQAKKAKTEKVSEEKESYLKDLMAISGHGGLFRFVSQGRNGIIVESIETGKRMQAFASMKVSALEDIAVYTEEEEIQLEQVIAAIHKYENGQEAISPKSGPDELKDYFSAILPEYDRERVYVSDIKKILSWYNLLLKYDLIETGKPAEKPSGKKEAEKEDDRQDDKKEKSPAPRPAVKKAPSQVSPPVKSHSKPAAAAKKTVERKKNP